MSRQPPSTRPPSCRGSIPQSVRERVEEILDSYCHLMPAWCRSVVVEVDDFSPTVTRAQPVTGTCASSRGEIVFVFPSDWLRLKPSDQELSIVFWFVLDDLSRGLTCAVGPVVDAVRQTGTPQGEGADDDLYTAVLPFIGSSALTLAQKAVRGERERAA